MGYVRGTNLLVEVGDEQHGGEREGGRGQRAQGGGRRRQRERAEGRQPHAAHAHSVRRRQARAQAQELRSQHTATCDDTTIVTMLSVD